MHITLEFYEHLREKIRVSDVVRQKVHLTRKSGEYLGLCPFHNEKSPSFTVNDVKRFYHCFGCGAHGDAIKFVASLSGLPYKDSAIKLANDYNIEIPKLTKAQEKLYEESNEIYNILQKSLEFFQGSLNNSHIAYLKTRGISDKIIKEFEIGFAPSGKKLTEYFQNSAIPLVKLANAGLIGKNQDGRVYEIFHDRIIFPIKNIYNKVVGFGARVLDNSMPKYINSPETIVFKKNEVLYGEDKAISSAYKKNYIILVEGYLDVITMHSAGFTETVASLGTAVTQNHLHKLWKYCDEIILCLDADGAGLKAIKKVIDSAISLINFEKKISFIKLPLGFDPDDTVKKHGKEFFINLIKNRINLSQMIWDLEHEEIDINTPENQAFLQSRLDTYCAKLSDNKLLHSYKRFVRDQMWKLLYSKSTKNKNISDKSELLKESVSPIELLESALCNLIIKYPQIIQQEAIRNFFLNANFHTEKLADFKWWFLENFTNFENLNELAIRHEIEKTRFFEINSISLKFSNRSFDVPSNKQIDYILLFEILHKKYYLALLQEECAHIMHDNINRPFEKINKYRQEILKVSDEIQRLNESFITKN